MVSSAQSGPAVPRASAARAKIRCEKRIVALLPMQVSTPDCPSPDRGEAETAVLVAADLVHQVDLPGEVLAHITLALGGALAGRQRNVVGLADKRAHTGFERQASSLPRRRTAGQDLYPAAGAQLGRGIAGDRGVLAGQHEIALRRQFVERLGEAGADREPGSRNVT